MIRTAKDIQENYRNSLQKITRTPENISMFLEQNTYLFKYPMADIVSIHGQNESATLVADFSFWNDNGRFINKGEQAIRVLSNINDNSSVQKHFFDIRQTTGKSVFPFDWTCTEKELSEIVEMQTEQKNLTLDQYVRKIVDATIKNDETGLIKDLTQYTLQQKFHHENDLKERLIDKAIGHDPVAFLEQVNNSNKLVRYTLNRLKPYFVEYMTVDQKEKVPEITEKKEQEIYEDTIIKQNEYVQEVLFETDEEVTKDGTEVVFIPKPTITTQLERKGFSFAVYPMAKEKLYGATPSEKINDNMQAIKLLKELEGSNRKPTNNEKEILARYVGWGGLPTFFDTRVINNTYEILRNELKELVTSEEYSQMEDSVLTAYYTDPNLIQEIFLKIEKMGFNGGKVLDPAMGTGNFYSAMPKRMKEHSELFGVELDPITGAIASYLHDDANVQIKPFEKTTFEKSSFDLVIGNIPFNDFKISDKKNYTKDLYIHDYFITRSLDLLKDDGILAVISSSGTLDKRDNSIRNEWAKNSTFLGAVRLPNNAFKKIAGTEVVTDILFFRKSPSEEAEKDWLISDRHSIDSQAVRYNNYFMKHPEQVVGYLSVKNFRGGTLTVLPRLDHNQSLEKQVVKSLNQLSNGIGTLDTMTPNKRSDRDDSRSTQTNYSSQQQVQEVKEQLPLPEPEDYPNFSYSLINDTLYYKDHNTITPVKKFSKLKKERIKGMIAIKQQVKDIIAMQQVQNYDQELFSLKLDQLNKTYDSFVNKYGHFHDDVNESAFRADDSCMLLQSLEIKQEDGSYKKADMFFQATIRPIKEITHVETSEDALIQSINQHNEVNLDYMMSLSDKSKEELITELEGKIFLDPLTLNTNEEKWIIREEYLSGDVKTKLTIIEPLKEELPHNYYELKAVQPEALGIKDIEYKLGSTWIPKEVYFQFIEEVLEPAPFLIRDERIELDFNAFDQKWFIKGKGADSGVIANQKYGTKRANGYRLVEESLNLKLIEIRDRKEEVDGKVKYVLNQKETILALDKQELLENRFKSWLFADAERAERLLNIYNDRFNRYVTRKYDGSNLVFNGLNPNYSLRPHQKNAVARILAEKRALLGHVVGSGKSLTMIASGMLLKEKGIINKPLYIVPNHLTREFGQELLRFYPTNNVLVTTEKDFEKQNRKQFTGRIATGNYDAIIIGQSQFEKIPLSKKRQIELINEEIARVSAGIAEQASEENKSWSFKQMKLHEKKLKERLKKLVNAKEKDTVIDFEDAGIDFMFVDEAHYYKNLYNYTKLSNIAGINTSHSQRATDMYQKTQYILDSYNHKGVVFATGTPISNSMGELFTMQRYLQPDILEQMGISTFDQWASTFGEITSSLELAPEGTNYQIKNRFAKFHNLPELMTSFSLVADIQTEDMLDLPVPQIKNGKATIVVTEASQAQNELMDSFSIRADNIRNGNVDPSEDNMLKVTHEAKLMALDMRLLDESYTSKDSSKVQKCCENVYEIYERTRDKLSTQMIFCDSGTPKKDKFNVYDEIKNQLMEMGIPSEDIAFIHDAKNAKQRELMFEKMRNGQLRILLGSTGKVGTGTNVQTKLIAAHHLDCPWRPSDLTQRDGRIVRQGNENKEVEIYRYITKSTFDSYLWQIQEQKLRYITQVMNNKSISRSCEDIDETVLTAAEIKAVATNNPLIAEKMNVDNRVMKLQLLESTHKDEQYKMVQSVKHDLPQKLENLRTDVEAFKKDKETTDKYRDTPFSINVLGKVYDERKEAGEAIHASVELLKEQNTSTLKIGTFKGLDLVLSKSSFSSLYLSLKGEQQYSTDINLHSPIGTISRVENISIDKSFSKALNKKEEIELRIKDTNKQIGQSFEYDQELSDLLKKQRKINLSLNGLSETALETESYEEQNYEKSELEVDSARFNKQKTAIKQKRQQLLERQSDYD